jgi:hypothetical protein
MVEVVTTGRGKSGPPETVLPGYLDQPPVFQRPRGPLTGVQVRNVIGASALDPLQDCQLPLGQGSTHIHHEESGTDGDPSGNFL